MQGRALNLSLKRCARYFLSTSDQLSDSQVHIRFVAVDNEHAHLQGF